ncbi:sigma-54 interaction domain-containing protein [Rubrivirga marina]|uniref:Sigma-54-dependent Fis family transcriptional regulator n=1 Tax=Rubrivirga marina TaxID=1196024 RepID=A0A271J029_9BACT|nr:sigma 54-interacting transcriptional regulator [Rubrivirga marina]PAP76710.1 sigma-54-dependent Fis family transcriptional regulator [Rubrivirga marina]
MATEAPQDARSALAALSEIAAALNSARDPAAVLDAVLDAALDALGAERGFVLLETDGGDAPFEVRASRNFSGEELAGVRPLSTSVVQEVLRTGEPVLVYQAEEDERYGGVESVVLQHIQSIACVPLRLRARQIGAIYLDAVKTRGRFTREHLPFLRAVADQAAIAIEGARREAALREENRRLLAEARERHGFDEIVGTSPAMEALYETLRRVIDTDATVLIEGETGTGKELVARALHYEGPRAEQPFVALFCGSLPDELLESELFGHKKGAFTGAATDKKGLFEAADGGTVFLDEVGDLSPKLQTALLRVLQTGEVRRVGDTATRRVDVRVVSATNRPLVDLVEDGDFREDLMYRLNTIRIETPPLRQRRADIPLLATHFLDRYAVGPRERVEGFTQEALDTLRRYRWPGNVRELEGTVERAVVLARGARVGVDDLRLPEAASEDVVDLAPGLTMKEIERLAVEQTLEAQDGNVSATARTLGVSRRWIQYRLKEWAADDAGEEDA